MLNSPVTTINARKRGTTRFLIGSTPSTCSASSSSRILRAPRSAVIAVPPTPARMIAVTNGANSRIDESTKKPPSRSTAPNSTRKLPAWRPGAPYPKAIVEIVSGSQQRRSMNRNCCTNSVPYGYGGRSAETSVLPVRIIMSPTCSSRLFVGRKTRSAAALTTKQTPPSGLEAYVMSLRPARRVGGMFGGLGGEEEALRGRARPGRSDRGRRLRRRRAPGRQRARGRFRDGRRLGHVPRDSAPGPDLEARDQGPQRRRG